MCKAASADTDWTLTNEIKWLSMGRKRIYERRTRPLRGVRPSLQRSSDRPYALIHDGLFYLITPVRLSIHPSIRLSIQLSDKIVFTIVSANTFTPRTAHDERMALRMQMLRSKRSQSPYSFIVLKLPLFRLALSSGREKY